MLTSFLRICIFFLSVFVCVTSRNQQNSILRIYSNLAEIIQPVDKLPLEFTNDDWNDIRSDSITLVGKDVNVTSQCITEKQKSLNGAHVYIRSPVSIDKTAIMFAKAILVDEKRNLVKIQDESVSKNEVLYFTVSQQDIFYMEEPSDSKFYVDFTYNTPNSKVFVSYLRSSFNWRTQYQLNLYNDRTDLIVMANIRNNGKSSVSVAQAELFSGDINLRIQSRQYSYDTPIAASRNSYMASKNVEAASDSIPTIGQSVELMGVHVFTINKPFMIDGQTNYLLPMFRPQVKVERYNSISKSFSAMSNTGKAQRSYRLKSDRYLSNGNCIVRELDRVVGETVIPNLAAKDKYEFSIGQDAEVIYVENVTLISSKQFQEEVTSNLTYNPVRTRSVYKIHVQVKNLKKRSIKVEYTQLFYSSKLELITSTNDICVRDGSSIKYKIALHADEEQVYSYNVELVN